MDRSQVSTNCSRAMPWSSWVDTFTTRLQHKHLISHLAEVHIQYEHHWISMLGSVFCTFFEMSYITMSFFMSIGGWEGLDVQNRVVQETRGRELHQRLVTSVTCYTALLQMRQHVAEWNKQCNKVVTCWENYYWREGRCCLRTIYFHSIILPCLVLTMAK